MVLEKIASYMNRAAISVMRVEFNPEENPVTIYKKQIKMSSAKKTHYCKTGTFIRVIKMIRVPEGMQR